LLRWLFENCDSFDDALRALRSAPAFVPFFVMLVGPKRGQSAVVELRTNGRNRVLQSREGLLCVSNHFPKDVYCDDDSSDSAKRLEIITRRTAACRAKTAKGALAILRHPTLTYGRTQQSMMLHCRSGEVFMADLE
jgi:predicted choloylglycine hydrolase